MDWNALLNNLTNWLLTEGVKIVIAFVLLFIGCKLASFLAKKIFTTMEKRHVDQTICNVTRHVINYGLKIVIVVCLLGYLGIETSGIAAVISSLGIAVGLAVQGALSNLAGGVLIIITRPFRVNDFIEAQGVSGTVEDINIIHTILRTPDNKVISLPNGALANSNIINYSVKDTRRVDFTFSIGYTADYVKAQGIVMDIFNRHELVLDDPAPFVRMSEHGASSINITARCWVKSADYWTVNFDVLESVKAEFDKNGIEIPFNQLDVHLTGNAN